MRPGPVDRLPAVTNPLLHKTVSQFRCGTIGLFKSIEHYAVQMIVAPATPKPQDPSAQVKKTTMALSFLKRDRTGTGGRRRAVVVDDEPDLCQIVRVALEGAGFEVLTVFDGVTGLETIRATRPQVVLLDIKMPRMNGYELLAALRADPTISATPVIVMTSLTDNSEKTDEQWREALSVAGFLSKPFDTAKLLTEVRRAVGDE